MKPTSDRAEASAADSGGAEKQAGSTSEPSATPSPVLDGSEPTNPEPDSGKNGAESRTVSDPDEAIRVALKAASDADDFDTVDALNAILRARRAKPKPAPVLTLARKG